MDRYCAYLRKSRADELREKLECYDALAHHRQMLEELADRMQVPISRWYSDGIKSGEKIEGREGMSALLRDVQEGRWDGVLVVEVERLTRGDMVDQGTVIRAFSDTGTLIVTPLKVYDPCSEADMEYFEFGMFMSRREFKTINKRLIAGRVASVKEGQHIANTAPYGYDKARVDGMKTLVPNGFAKYVVMIWEWYADGVSYREMTHRLDAMGAPPMKSQKWHPASVRNIVLNPVYLGKVMWNRTKQEPYYENGRRRFKTAEREDYLLVDGLHPAIIPDDLAKRVAERVAQAPVRGGYETRNPYGRLLVCAECGKALRYCEGRSGPMLTHLHRGEGCKTKGCSMRVLDAVVCEALLKIADELDSEVEGGGQRPTRSQAAECRDAAERFRKAISDNFDRMERGVISESDFVERRKVLEGRIAESLAEAERLESLSPESFAEKAMTVRECIKALSDPGLDAESKRRAVWAVIDRIEYRNRAPRRSNEIELEIFLR